MSYQPTEEEIAAAIETRTAAYEAHYRWETAGHGFGEATRALGEAIDTYNAAAVSWVSKIYAPAQLDDARMRRIFDHDVRPAMQEFEAAKQAKLEAKIRLTASRTAKNGLWREWMRLHPELRQLADRRASCAR